MYYGTRGKVYFFTGVCFAHVDDGVRNSSEVIFRDVFRLFWGFHSLLHIYSVALRNNSDRIVGVSWSAGWCS